MNKLEKEYGDRMLAASILSLLSQVYDTWRRSVALMLQDKYDVSVAGHTRYLLHREKVPTTWITRNAG